MAASSCRVLLSSSRAPGFLHGLVPLSYTVNLVPMRLDLIENKPVMKCLHLFIFFRCWQHFVSHLSHVDWQKATHCLFSKYQENSNYWMLQFILTVSKQKIFGITLNVILKKRGKSERLQCNPTGQLSRPKWMSLSLPLMGSDCQHYEKDPYRGVYLTSRRSLALKSHRRWGVAGRKKCECEWELEEARHGREEKLPVQ